MTDQSSSRSTTASLLLLLLVSLGVRLAWGISRPVDSVSMARLPDQVEYLSLARSVLHGKGLQFFDARFGQTIYAYRMPGYPLFVAVLGADARLVRIAQAILDTSTVLAIFLLAIEVLPKGSSSGRASLLAAGLLAVNPFMIYFSGLVLSETLFVCLLAWSLWLLVRGASPGSAPQSGVRSWSWLAGIVLLALSVHVRPSAAPLPFLLAAGAAWVNRTRREVNRANGTAYQLSWVLPSGVIGAVLLLSLLPWALRNARSDVLGRWIWTTTNGGITAYDGWNPTAKGGSDQAFVRAMPELRQMSEVERSEYLERLAWQFVREHPGRAIKLMVVKLWRTWSPVPLGEQYSGGWYRLAAVLFSLPLDLMILASLISRGVSRAAKMYLLLPAIYLSVVHMASVGSLRYRLPAEPPMAILAASIVLRAPRAAEPRGH